MPFALGIDIGGTFTKMVALAADHEVLAESRVPTESRAGATELVARVVAEARAMCAGAGLDLARAVGVGIGLAGLVDRASGRLMASPNLPGFEGFAAAQAFGQSLLIPAIVENDAGVFALAESRLGAGRGRDPIALLTLGTGVGGAIVHAGRIFHGWRGFAGEFGHTGLAVEEGPRCACGQQGCIEAYLSSRHVVALALDLSVRMAERPGPMLARALSSGEATARTVGEAARAGDPVARAVFTELGRYLGLAVANIISALNPAAVIIGGGVSLAGDVLIDTARATALARVMPPLAEGVAILPASLGDRGGTLGAALLALDDGPDLC